MGLARARKTLVQLIQMDSLCKPIRNRLKEYLQFVDLLPVLSDLPDIAKTFFKMTHKSIHIENYPTKQTFIIHFDVFFQTLKEYVTQYNNIPSERRREQDNSAYQLLCNHWFVESTPCFELLSEQLVQLLDVLAPKPEFASSSHGSRTELDFSIVFQSQDIQKFSKRLQRHLQSLTGERFFHRLIRNFQLFLCFVIQGDCPLNKSMEKKITRLYTLENLFNFMNYSDYFNLFDELHNIDFADELQSVLNQYDIGLVPRVDYSPAQICCE